MIIKKIIYILLLFCIYKTQAQTVTPQVINSAGSYRIDNATGISVTDNVGEPFVQTRGPISGMMITEGFLQPFIVIPGFNISLLKNDVSCLDRNDGRLSFDINTIFPKNKYVFTTKWSPASICPNDNCQSIDNLPSGTYSVTVHFTYTNSAGFVRQDSSSQSVVINSASAPCVITIYTGSSPVNGDATHNWRIENIDMFPNNKVSIFNRWGTEMFTVNGYVNEDPEKSWPKQKEFEKLIPGTYFYIIDLGNGTKPFKGWVELVKN